MKYFSYIVALFCIGVLFQIHPLNVIPANAQQPTFGPTCEVGVTCTPTSPVNPTSPPNTVRPSTPVVKMPKTGTGSDMLMILVAGGMILTIGGIGALSFASKEK